MSSHSDDSSVLRDPVDFPALYQSTDQSSLDGQKRFLWATKVRLVGLTLAAVCGAFDVTAGRVNPAGLAAVTFFAVALAAELYLLVTKPDRVWYEGRAAAESVKTMTWRYAVRGNPFGDSIVDADEEFLHQVNDILHDLGDLYLDPSMRSRSADHPGHAKASWRGVYHTGNRPTRMEELKTSAAGTRQSRGGIGPEARGGHSVRSRWSWRDLPWDGFAALACFTSIFWASSPRLRPASRLGAKRSSTTRCTRRTSLRAKSWPPSDRRSTSNRLSDGAPSWARQKAPSRGNTPFGEQPGGLDLEDSEAFAGGKWRKAIDKAVDSCSVIAAPDKVESQGPRVEKRPIQPVSQPRTEDGASARSRRSSYYGRR